MAACKRCGSPILWGTTINDRPMPIDSESNEDGNVRVELVKDPTVRGGIRRDVYVLGPLERLAALEEGELLYMPHHATCPRPPARNTTTPTCDNCGAGVQGSHCALCGTLRGDLPAHRHLRLVH